MKKGSRLKKFGDIIFLIGVVIFVAALICGKFVEEFDALTVNIIMGVGLIFEAIGVAISFRTDRIEQVDEKKSAEDKVLEEVKNDIPEEKVEGIVEAEVTTIKEEPAVKEEVATEEDNKEEDHKEGIVPDGDVAPSFNENAKGVMKGFKYCRNCGNRLPVESKFCDKCGSRVDY